MHVKTVLNFFIAGLFLWQLLFALPAFALPASSPLEVIKSGTNRALEILNNKRAQGQSLREKKAEILDIVDDYFDFHEMAKRALGRPWKEQPPEKQKDFVRLFKQLLFNSYVDKVDTYTGSNERVV